MLLRYVSDGVTGSDISRSFLQTAEEEEVEEDDITGYSNGDMGLQARALYDYQAGKSLSVLVQTLLHGH
jgi:hypothetical protein